MDSLLTGDYPALQSTMILVIIVVLAVNLLVDIVFALADPRIRFG